MLKAKLNKEDIKLCIRKPSLAHHNPFSLGNDEFSLLKTNLENNKSSLHVCTLIFCKLNHFN